MYKFTLTTLALMGLASAQSTTELFLVGFDQQNILGSVIASDATATTYSLACGDPSSDDCGVPPSFTFTQGPSTVHYIYTDDDTPGTETIELSCQITDSVSGVCAGTVIDDLGSTTISTATTTPFSDGGSALGGMVVTITAGAAASSNTVASTSATPTGSESSKKSSTSAGGKTTSTSTGASGTGSAATGSGSKTSSSTGAGAPMVTRAPWVVGGAAAALVYAAM